MSEKDMFIDRLVKKIKEKEYEIAELRKMLTDREILEKIKEYVLFEIKRDLAENFEILKKVSELESKILEIRRAVESIVSEITYIKGELKEMREKYESPDKKAEIQSKVIEGLQHLKGEEDIKIASEKKEEAEINEKKVDRKIEVEEKEEELSDEDIIICD